MLAMVNENAIRSFDDVEPGVPYPQDYIDCLLGGSSTLLSQSDSFRNTEVVIRAQESATTGQLLKL